VFLPAGRPSLQSLQAPTLLAYPGQTLLTVAELDLGYSSTTLQGDLLFYGLHGAIVKRTPTGLVVVSPAAIFQSVSVAFNGDIVPGECDLSSGGLTVNLNDGQVVQRGDKFLLSLVCDIRADAPIGNYMIRFDDSTFCDLIDRNLLTSISPVLAGNSYPILSTEISITAANLAESFTNFPNPFNPANGEATIIGYVLAEDAYVDIELFTITGQLVSQLVSNAYRSAGSHRSDTWTGVNDKSLNVLPGTYFCRVTARYTSGKQESFTRKIAVIR
jgi:hypothetical protein